jgi:mono/diheme cytochrome c family protein
MEELMQRCAILLCLIGTITCLTLSVLAQERGRPSASAAVASSTGSAGTNDDTSATHSAGIESALRIEGEKRFRTNCGRCHMAPHKFPPRVMATAIRHMRVRATLTDEDMRLILHYMTQ